MNSYVSGSTVYITTNAPSFMENQPVLFTCNASNLSSIPVVKWFIGTRKESSWRNNTTGDFGSYSVVEKLVYTPKREDFGFKVICEVSGSIDQPMRATYGPLEIKYPPSSTHICTTQGDERVDSKAIALISSGESLNVTCTALGSNPASHVVWEVRGQRDGYTALHDDYFTPWRSDATSGGWGSGAFMEVKFLCGTCTLVVVCHVMFPENESYRDEQLLVHVHRIQPETSTANSSTTQPNEVTSTTQLDEKTSTDNSTNVKVYVIVTVSAAVFLCVVIVIAWRFPRKPKRRQPPSINEDTECPSADCVELEESGFQLPDVDYNFPRENIELLEVLGSGNFGQVYKANAKDILEVGIKSLVAVKTLKKSSSCDLLANFEKEINVHQALTKHPNVVSMLGYCTNKDPFYLILEYLPGGNLQDHLRKKKLSWKESKEENLVIEPALPSQLLTFASQIANGMDYLSFKGCIHRDLASRNILLSEDLLCKLSDFGLARDVSATEQYEMTSRGLIPVRWLAMECLLDNTYTTMSDVWSFGVLLWEIVTLGAHPYRGMSYDNIIDCLVEGHRLPQPAHCGKQLYLIMKDCWKEVPRSRPTFLSLKRTLDVMIADAPMYVSMTNFHPDMYI